MRLRTLLLSFALTTSSVTVARADLLAQAVDAAQAAPPPRNTLLSWAGSARQTSLPELLEVAIRQSPALASAKLDVAIAEAQIEQTLGRKDWLIAAQANGSFTESGVIAGATSGSSRRLDIGAEIAKPLSTGGRIGLRAGTTYTRNETSTLLGDSTFWSDSVSITAYQPLLRGRGSRIFDATEQRARISRDANVLARRQAALDTVQAIVSAYWDLVLAQRQVSITEASLALARERLQITQIGVQGGKIANAEIPAVEQIIATREEDVLGGELAVIERSIALRRAVNMQIAAGDIALRVDGELDARDRDWAFATLLERAYSASPQLAQLEKQVAGATIEIEVTENGLLPQLDLDLAFGPTGVAESFGDAAKETAKFGNLQGVASLTYSQTLSQHQVRGRTKELRHVREKIRVTQIDVRAQIAQALARAVAQIELAKRRVALSQRAIDLATENIRIEKDRFNLGKSTNFDVLSRVEEQRQAELRKAQALIDWHKAESVVQALTGDLLPAYGIEVD
jgi:outer membrane protein